MPLNEKGTLLEVKKSELITCIANQANISPRQADDALSSMLEKVIEALSLQQSVQLAGFGTFAVVRRTARIGRDPRTGEPISIPARNKVNFRPSGQLKNIVNSH